MKAFIHGTKLFVTVTVATTLLCGLVYVSAQQVLRLSANDPQVQMAEDTAAALAKGETPEPMKRSTPSPGQTDMAQSLAPYLINFDESFQPLASTVQLDGKTPVPPAGVFAYAKAHGENRLTWQPRRSARSAIVVVHYDGPQPGFVLAGRSLRETEVRVEMIGRLIAAGWVGLLAALVAVTICLRILGGAGEPAPPR
jgi:hypothetical protein